MRMCDLRRAGTCPGYKLCNAFVLAKYCIRRMRMHRAPRLAHPQHTRDGHVDWDLARWPSFLLSVQMMAGVPVDSQDSYILCNDVIINISVWIIAALLNHDYSFSLQPKNPERAKRGETKKIQWSHNVYRALMSCTGAELTMHVPEKPVVAFANSPRHFPACQTSTVSCSPICQRHS